jgi:hypothetical protein
LRIWTIQPASLYERLKAEQVLLVDGRCGDRISPHAYHWMIEQMRRRLPPSKARFPWWGWYRWESVRRAKPDLRSGWHLARGTKGTRIELELDEREVLLSDFDDWHYVLNHWFLSHDKAENDQFDREQKKAGYYPWGQYPEPLRSKVLASWERIFDFAQPGHDWRGRFRTKAIQATFWELRLKDVTDVTFFTARGRGF